MPRLAALVASVALMASAASAAPLWSRDGHEITASIAQLLMNEQANSTVSSILDGQTLEEVSTWADSYKHTRAGKYSEDLHFVDCPDWACTYKPSFCPNDMCVVGAILNYTDRATSQTGEEQQIALKFVTHFLGDIHQPMHVANKDDRGGNSIRGDFDDGNQHGSTNLHFIWDSGLIGVRMQDFGNSNFRYAVYLYQQIQNGKFTEPAAQWTECQSGEYPCPDEWAAVTAATACSNGYTDSQGQHIQSGFNLGADYYNFNKDVLDQQLAMGGVRLAKLMNQLYGSE